MARIITVTNQKGGTGKTTTSINLAAYLVASGRFVLLVDLDPQANATSGMGIASGSVEKSLYHALIEENTNISSLIKKTKITGLNMICASQDLAGATVDLVSLPNREFRLRNALKSIRTHYDYIVIDSPPSLGLLTINGLVAAEEVLIPVQCEYYALEGLSQLLNTINLVKINLQPDLTILGALLTMYDSRNRLSHQVAKEVRRHFPSYVFNAVIPRSIKLAEAPSFGEPISIFASDSFGAKGYKQLAEEVISFEKKLKTPGFSL